MIKVNDSMQLLEPATRRDLIREIARLNTIITNAIITMRKFSAPEAAVLKIAFLRTDSADDDSDYGNN